MHEWAYVLIQTHRPINTHSAVLCFLYLGHFFVFFLGADINAMRSGSKEVKSRKIRLGQCFPNTMIVFDKSEGSPVNLVGKSKGYRERADILYRYVRTLSIFLTSTH